MIKCCNKYDTMKLQKSLREALCTHKGQPQKQLSIPPSLVALGESKALTNNCFYLFRFLKSIKERNKDTSFHQFPSTCDEVK